MRLGMDPCALEWFCCGCSHRHALARAHACGGSKCKGADAFPEGRLQAGLHKRSAEDWGDSLRARGDGVSLGR